MVADSTSGSSVVVMTMVAVSERCSAPGDGCR